MVLFGFEEDSKNNRHFNYIFVILFTYLYIFIVYKEKKQVLTYITKSEETSDNLNTVIIVLEFGFRSNSNPKTCSWMSR